MRYFPLFLACFFLTVLAGCSSPAPEKIPFYPVQVKLDTSKPISDADRRLLEKAFSTDFWLSDDAWAMIKLDFPEMILEKVGAPSVDCGEVKMVIWRGDYQTLFKQKFYADLHLSSDEKRITGSLEGVNYIIHFRAVTAYNMKMQGEPTAPVAPPDLYAEEEQD